MRTVKMTKNFDFQANPQAVVAFRDGETYERVTEAQAEAIVAAGAGEIIPEGRKKNKDE